MTVRGGQAKNAYPAEQRISTLHWFPTAPSKYLKRESIPNNAQCPLSHREVSLFGGAGCRRAIPCYKGRTDEKAWAKPIPFNCDREKREAVGSWRDWCSNLGSFCHSDRLARGGISRRKAMAPYLKPAFVVAGPAPSLKSPGAADRAPWLNLFYLKADEVKISTVTACYKGTCFYLSICLD